MTKDAFIVLGPPTSGKSTQGLYLAETARAQIVRGKEILPELSDVLEATRHLVPDSQFVPALERKLSETTSPRIVFDNIPRTIAQTEIVMEWAKSHGVNIHVARLELSEDEVVDRATGRLVCPKCGESFHSLLKPSQKPGVCDRDGISLERRRGDDPSTIRKGFKDHDDADEALVDSLGSLGAVIHRVSATGTTPETARRLFTELSPVLFYKPEMAQGYYQLLESLGRTDSRHMMFSGVPVFFYGGRALMKDFDILVPDDKIESLASDLKLSSGVKDSSVAFTRYVDIAPGVEIDSNLTVKTPGGPVEFSFDFLWPEVVYARIMGLRVPLMGLEDTILFKAALGRLGTDDWGKHKDDISDIEGLMGAQSVNLSKLVSRAESLTMIPRLREVLSRINVRI
ncbi:MAG: nucleoside monophosphate kinase [Patescibacteria group bacterium]